MRSHARSARIGGLSRPLDFRGTLPSGTFHAAGSKMLARHGDDQVRYFLPLRRVEFLARGPEVRRITTTLSRAIKTLEAELARSVSREGKTRTFPNWADGSAIWKWSAARPLMQKRVSRDLMQLKRSASNLASWHHRSRRNRGSHRRA